MRKTILIVDDEPAMALPIEWMLRREGYNVELCSTIKEVKAYIKKTPPDLILLDIMLPDGDSGLLDPRAGVDFLKKLKSEDNPARAIPVIMVTVRGEQEIERECLDDGAVGCIRKMAAATDVKKMVKELI